MEIAIKPDYQKTIEFLKLLYPAGPWVLTAISPSRKDLPTDTFTDSELVLRWLETHGGTSNLYYTLNPLVKAANKKPSRGDIKSMSWLHVDIDPRANEPLPQEQERIVTLLNNLPSGIPQPTAIVSSGGGFQALWRLSNPMEINGAEALYEEAARYNRYLELSLGGDNCFNVDRILRLPGTINRPDERKRKRGRVNQLALLVSWKDVSYSLESFKQAPLAQNTKERAISAHATKTTVAIPSIVQRLSSVDELPQEVSDTCKVVIVQGRDPDNPNRFPSRSEWLFYVCCELVRAKCTDEVIYSVITDPTFNISESVIEAGVNMDKYARRQIERAKEFAVSPELQRLNDKFAIIGNYDGHCVVVEEVDDPTTQRAFLSAQSFPDFKNRFLREYVQVGIDPKTEKPLTCPLGKWWLQNRDARYYDRVVFSPGKNYPDCYNLWQGFAYEPKPGDCSLYLDHLKKYICNGVTLYYEYLLNWMARSVQFPNSQGEVAVVLRGKKGTGKGTTVDLFGKLFGRHKLAISKCEHITGRFNNHLRDCVLLYADEAFFAGDPRHEPVLKAIITEPDLFVERKYGEGRQVANCLHIIMSSNERWVVPASGFERRFFVLDVSDDKIGDFAHFAAIRDQMKSGGYEALLDLLLKRDLSSFNVRDVPKTDALQEQKMHTLSAEEGWWFEILRNGQLLNHHNGWVRNVSSEELLVSYLDHTKNFGRGRHGSSVRFGLFLKRVCPKIERYQAAAPITIRTISGETKEIQRAPMLSFPPLMEARMCWDIEQGDATEWPEIQDLSVFSTLPADNEESSDVPF